MDVSAPQWVHLGTHRIDLKGETLWGPDGVVHLTTIERQVLVYLAHRLGQEVSREALHQEVWGHGAQVLSRAADTTVRRLRKKLHDDARRPRHLITVHGKGYRLMGTHPQEDVHDALAAIHIEAGRGVPPFEQTGQLEGFIENALTQGAVDDAARGAIALLRVSRRTNACKDQAVALTHRVLQANPADGLAMLLCCEVRKPTEEPFAAVLRGGSTHSDPRVRCRALLALDRPEEALVSAVASGAPALLAQATGRLAGTLAAADPERAQALFLDALKHAQVAQEPWEEAVIQGNYAHVLRTVGALPEAEARYRAAAEQFKALADDQSLATAWMSLGTLLHHQWRLSEAKVFYEDAGALAEAVDARLLWAKAQVNRSALLLDEGLDVDPLGFDALLGVFRAHDCAEYEALALANQGRAWLGRDQPALARVTLERALAAPDLREHQRAEIEGELATVAWAQGAVEEAWQRMERALTRLALVPERQGLVQASLKRWQGWAEQAGLAIPQIPS